MNIIDAVKRSAKTGDHFWWATMDYAYDPIEYRIGENQMILEKYHTDRFTLASFSTDQMKSNRFTFQKPKVNP